MAQNPYVAFVKKFRNDPVAFVKGVFNVEPDPLARAVIERDCR